MNRTFRVLKVDSPFRLIIFQKFRNVSLPLYFMLFLFAMMLIVVDNVVVIFIKSFFCDDRKVVVVFRLHRLLERRYFSYVVCDVFVLFSFFRTSYCFFVSRV